MFIQFKSNRTIMYLINCLKLAIIVFGSISFFVAVSQPADKKESVKQPAVLGTEVFLIHLNSESDSTVLGEPVNISNSPGYDSQPSFSPDSARLYFTHSDGKQTDIAIYHLGDKKTWLLQKTPESEYSPTPLYDKDSISVVRVDRDKEQRVYLLNSDNAVVVDEGIKQVGYHAWHGFMLWTFILNGKGGDLYAILPNEKPVKVWKNIGRTLTVDKHSGDLYFIDKNTQPWRIMRIHGIKEKPQFVIDLPTGVQDFARDETGRFWIGIDNTVHIYEDSKNSTKQWQPLSEVIVSGYSGISRIAVSPDRKYLSVVLDETH